MNPKFITINDCYDNKIDININHIFQISEEESYDKEIITTISIYTIPDCKNGEIYHYKTYENKESFKNRLQELVG